MKNQQQQFFLNVLSREEHLIKTAQQINATLFWQYKTSEELYIHVWGSGARAEIIFPAIRGRGDQQFCYDLVCTSVMSRTWAGSNTQHTDGPLLSRSQ